MKRFQTLAVLLGLGFSAGTGWSAVVVNDGTTVNNLVRLINTDDLGRGDADTSLVAANGELEASQSGTAGFFAARTVWYAADRAPTSGVYSVSADFKPADVTSERRGGVMGWLDSASANGMAFQVQPAGQTPSFQVKLINFNATNDAVNETLSGLFNLDGTQATEDFTSAGADLGSYVPMNFATFQLEFTAPTATDLGALSNATARITAKVFQGIDTGGAPIQVSRTIELLTDLAVPPPASHRFGYFAFWAQIFAPGETIGYLDNLSASGVMEVVNTPPVVTVTSPANNAVFSEPATIAISANASDPDGTIARVEFFDATTMLGTVTNAPYDFAWTNVPAGSYSLTARATDNLGAATTSSPVNATVTTSSGTGPPMTIVQNGTFIEISWPASGYQLQMKTDLSSAAWTDVPDTVSTNRVTVQVTSANMFFRLVQGSGQPGATISIQRSGASVVVSWSATRYRLQARSNVAAGVWEDLVSTANQYSENTTNAARFYRLISP